MEYREIVAVTGIGGLFQLLNTKSDGAIVRNLEDKSTKFIPARIHNVTPIESIEIYTVEDNVRLNFVFQTMKDKETTIPLVDSKKATNVEIKAYFKEILPIIDEDRVYVSDMKKILKWYLLLKANDLLNFEEEKAVEEVETQTKQEEVVATEEVKETKPKKATKAKKEITETVEEKPTVAKKTTRKKKEVE